MRLRERYRRLNLWNKIAFWGAAASILGLVIGLAMAMMPGQRTAKPLADLLEVRAERVVRMLDDDKQTAISSIQSGHGLLGMKPRDFSELGMKPEDLRDSLEAFVQRTDRTKALFLELHRAHIDALHRGDYVVAHEIVTDIHYLIYAHYEDIASSAYRGPRGVYSPISYYRTGADLYPGQVPEQFINSVPAQTRKQWADTPSYRRYSDLNMERLERVRARRKR